MNASPLLPQAESWIDGTLLSGLMSKSASRRIAVGWSGGADSTLLLLALNGLGFDTEAWHVDHAWHEASAEHSGRLRRQAEVWRIPYRSVRLKHPGTSNREAAARAGRYAAFERLSAESGIEIVCLGHHLLDQAETVCMRMLQGAGVHGIRGMQQVRPRDRITICRPLLYLPQSEIAAALQAVGVAWHEDPSNEDLTLWRNRLRKEFFPAISRAGVDPVQLFTRWQYQAEKIAGLINRHLDPIDIECDDKGCWLDWRVWQAQPPLMRAYLLQRMMHKLFGGGVVAGRRHIEQVDAWMQKGGQGGLDLSRSRLMRKDGRLQLYRKAQKDEKCIIVS